VFSYFTIERSKLRKHVLIDYQWILREKNDSDNIGTYNVQISKCHSNRNERKCIEHEFFQRGPVF